MASGTPTGATLRQAPPEGIPKSRLRKTIPGQTVPRGPNKKSPRLEALGSLAEAWGKGRPTTSHDYRVALDLQARWRNLTPASLTEHHLREAVQDWKNSSLSPMTVHRRRSSLKKFILFIDRTFHTDLALLVPKVSLPSQRSLTAQPDEFDRVLALCPLWMRTFLLFCRTMGLRHGEALSITPANYNPESRTLNFKRKMGGTSNLPVPPQLHQLIEIARDMNPHDSVLHSLGLKARKTPGQTIGKIWRAAKKKAGANPNLHIHDLRRTIATELYSASKDLRAVQTLLGHRSLNSTILYIAPMDPDKLRSLLDDLHPLQNLHNMKPASDKPQ